MQGVETQADRSGKGDAIVEGRHAGSRTEEDSSYADLLQRLVAERKPTRILETGAYHGDTAILLAQISSPPKVSK